MSASKQGEDRQTVFPSVLCGLLFISSLLSSAAQIINSSSEAMNGRSYDEIIQKEKQFIANYHRDFKSVEMKQIWLQPSFRKEKCEVAYLPQKDAYDKHLFPSFRIFWDGDCKNGRAYGLGRQIIRLPDSNYEIIARYDSSDRPEIFYFKDNLTDIYWVGSISAKRVVAGRIKGNNFYTMDANMPANISYTSTSNIGFGLQSSRAKIYPNFGFFVEEDENTIEYSMTSTHSPDSEENDVLSGYKVVQDKNSGKITSYEIFNEFELHQIILPPQYIEHLQKIDQTIKIHTENAQKAEQVARRRVHSYLHRLCKLKNTYDLSMYVPTYLDLCGKRDEL
ncbi:MAG: hypothetical protein J6M93_07365 [Succinivibrio sp.]|nr:hypothetical protein [Succinivibrio sp.]